MRIINFDNLPFPLTIVAKPTEFKYQIKDTIEGKIFGWNNQYYMRIPDILGADKEYHARGTNLITGESEVFNRDDWIVEVDTDYE